MTATQPIKYIAALDVGQRRIGVSVTSLLARLPQPHGVITNDEHTLADIRKLISKQNICILVVGLPRGLEGQDTEQTKYVRQFADNIKHNIDIPIHFQDEALTSKQAETELNKKGLYNKEAVDALAATYILTDFLSQHPEVKS